MTDSQIVSNSNNFTISVTQKPKYIIYNALINANPWYSFTYMVDVNNEIGWRMGSSSGQNFWDEQVPYNRMVDSISSSSVILKGSEFSEYTATVVVYIYY